VTIEGRIRWNMAEVDDDDCGGGMLIWTVLLGVAPVVDDDILPLPVVLS
jgi:hypothetical protein